MNVVLCTGIMRSGSTWAFNVLRVLVEYACEPTGVAPWSGYLDGARLDKFLGQNMERRAAAVVKCHYTGPVAGAMIHDGAIKNICTLRDPRDCVASRQTFKPGEPLDESIALVKSSCADARRYGDETLFVPYEQVVKAPAEAIRDMSRHILLRLRDQVYEEIAREMSASKLTAISNGLSTDNGAVAMHGGLVDPVTSLHTNHIGTGEIGRYKRDFDEITARRVSSAVKEEVKWWKGQR